MNWYEGCDNYIPKTNNALEGFNRALKENYLFYKKNYLIDIINLFGKILEKKSVESMKEIIENKIVYSNIHYLELKSNLVYKDNFIEGYCVIDINENNLENFENHLDFLKSIISMKKTFKNLYEYKMFFKFPFVGVKKNNDVLKWENFCCTCKFFRNKNKCIHINFIGLKIFKNSNLLTYMAKNKGIGRPKEIKRNDSLNK